MHAHHNHSWGAGGAFVCGAWKEGSLIPPLPRRLSPAQGSPESPKALLNVAAGEWQRCLEAFALGKTASVDKFVGVPGEGGLRG